MMSVMNIKEITKADIPLIKEWFLDDESGRQFVADYENVEKIIALTNNYRKFWLISDDKAPMGFIDLEIVDSKGYFAYYIAPSFRGKGYSTQFLNLLEEKAKQLSVNTLLGYAETNNIASIKAIQKAGYIQSQNPDQDGLLEFSKTLT